MLLDQARLDALRHDVGEDVFADVVQMSLEEIEDAMATLSPPDAAKLHFLKGCALTIGLSDLSMACAVAEADLKADPTAIIAVETLQKIYSESRAYLMAKCQIVAR